MVWISSGYSLVWWEWTGTRKKFDLVWFVGESGLVRFELELNSFCCKWVRPGISGVSFAHAHKGYGIASLAACYKLCFEKMV